MNPPTLIFDEESILIDDTMTKNSVQSIPIQKQSILSQQKGFHSFFHTLEP